MTRAARPDTLPTVQGGAPPGPGTFTFLFIDIEGSTRLWEEHGDAMRHALASHDEIVRDVVERSGGTVFKTTGDGACAVFDAADAALTAARDVQRELAETGWPRVRRLRDRIALHTGTASRRDDDYFGPTLNRCARLMAIAHGGQVLVSQATATLVRDMLDGGCELIDLGEHRLRDLSRPERVFQLAAPGVDREFPPLRSLETSRTNLPVQLTSYVGRDRDVDDIARLLGAHRLVTVTGVGGVGKTRLALQVAAQVLPEFSDGAWLCELANASDDESMMQLVAAALNVQPHTGLTLAASVVESLRGKRALVVLDNCEHVVDAAATLVEDVLRAADDVRILATSREGLAVDGERVRPLRPLRVSTGDPATSDAVRLFAERAQAASSEFVLDAANTGAVIEICRRLDGIPLAIELAAARVPAMSPADIAGHLDERFRLLTGGRRTAVERHQTLRAAVAWSYDVLEPNQRVVFDRLAVFAGGFDADAVTAVVGDETLQPWDVLDALAGLVAKSLVVAVVGDRGSTRYEMLETLRHFARERLEAGAEPDAWRRRHARYYVDVAERLGRALIGPDELEARDDLGAELDNIRTAVNWSLDRDDPADFELGLRTIAMLNGEAVMYPASGVSAWAARAVPRLESAPPELRAAVLAPAAYHAHRHGDSELAISRAREAARYGPVPGIPTPGMSLLPLGMLYATSGRVEEGLEAITEGERMLSDFGASDYDLARHWLQMVTTFLLGGDEQRARDFAEAGLERARRCGNPSAIAQGHYTLGAALASSDPERALVEFEAALTNSTLVSRSAMGGPALFQAALLRARGGDFRRATQDLRDAIVFCHETGQRPQLDGAFGYAVDVLVCLGRSRDAFVVVGAIVRGALQHLLEMSLPPERDPAAALAAARIAVTDQERRDAMARGAAMTYEQLVAWLVDVLDEIQREMDSA